MNIRRFRVVLALLALVGFGQPVSAYDIRTREEWARYVVEVEKGVCRDEDKKLVVKKLDYSAILIMHNETDEALDILKKASATAKSTDCRSAIQRNFSVPQARSAPR